MDEETRITDVLLLVGHDPAATKARFLGAIRRAEAGASTGEHHIRCETWDGPASVLNGKRLELLHHLVQHPAASVAELGRTLGRIYNRVHEDVEILTVAGLLDRTEGGGVDYPVPRSMPKNPAPGGTAYAL